MSKGDVQILVSSEVKKLIRVDRKVNWIPIDRIKTRFFVRQGMDEDRVLTLASLIEKGNGQHPALLVTRGTCTLVDGRSRLESYKLLERKKVPVVFCDEADDKTLITCASLANADARDSQPSRKQDYIHTLQLLINAGMSEASMKIHFESRLTPSVFRAYLRDAHSKLRKQRMSKARHAVALGSSIFEAASTYDVSEAELMKLISGSSSNSKKVQNPFVFGAKAGITKCASSFALSLGRNFQIASERLEDGEILPEEVESIISHAERRLERHRQILTDHKRRLRAKMETLL